MFWLTLFSCIALFWFDSALKVWGEERTKSEDKNAKENAFILNEILKKIEERYIGPGFRAEFEQQSTITAMEITDSASGKLFVKRPGKMRWEYVLPEAQIITSDSNDLWIYRPEDNQVLIGKAPSFFADGKGATFLSDVKNVRKEFIVTLEGSDKKGNSVIKLVPKKKSTQLTEIRLTISSHTDTIDQIVTKNEYSDETRIQISKYQFNQDLAEDLFVLKIPNGADVLQLDQ